MEYWNMCESQRFLLIAREGMSPYYKTAAKRFLCVYKIYVYIHIYIFAYECANEKHHFEIN